MLKCCKLFSHVHYSDEGPVHISDPFHRWRLSNEGELFGELPMFGELPRFNVQKHDLGPPTYSFQAEETHGNYCNQSFVNSGCSNLRAISGVGCISL